MLKSKLIILRSGESPLEKRVVAIGHKNILVLPLEFGEKNTEARLDVLSIRVPDFDLLFESLEALNKLFFLSFLLFSHHYSHLVPNRFKFSPLLLRIYGILHSYWCVQEYFQTFKPRLIFVILLNQPQVLFVHILNESMV